MGPWRRYVAIGDSTTEGLEDPDANGRHRGWADRLAEHIVAHQGDLEYANIAIRGKLTRQIRDEQLPVALSMNPDLVTVVAGMNDILNPTFDATEIATMVEQMLLAFARTGATVLTFTLPDPTPNLPFTALLQPRVLLLNERLRLTAARAGAVMVDVAAHPSQSNPRLWATDRLHGNSDGHAIVARGLAHGLGLPGFDESWLAPLDEASQPPLEALVAQLSWTQQHALPWLWRTVTGRPAGEGIVPKRPVPAPLSETETPPAIMDPA
jgi:lysophospholipase L1-like esterase